MVFHPRSRISKMISRRGKFDDEMSQGSTHIVASLPTKPQVEQSPLKPQCAVHFDESKNAYHENSTLSFEDCKDLWYNKEESKLMKDAYSRDHKTLSRAASPSATTDGSFSIVLNRVYDACCDNSISEDLEAEMVQQFQLHNDMLLGMEQGVVKLASRRKHSRREKLLDLVYNLPHDHPSMDRNELAELMRSKSRAISKPTRHYALSIGRAQSMVQ